MPQPLDRLTKLLAFHENAAAALRMTITLVQVPAMTGRPRGSSNQMEAALALDAARRARNGTSEHHGKVGRKPGVPNTGAYVASLLAKRRVTDKLLKGFDATKPRTAADVLGNGKARFVGGWLRAGLLKRKGDGYVRTAKPFDPENYNQKQRTEKTQTRRARRALRPISKKAAKRASIVARLAKFDTTEPRTVADALGTSDARSIVGLVRRKYLKPKGDGYVRTDKPFDGDVNP